MQYFGYLRRDPAAAPDSDLSGYNFWLNKLNQFGGNLHRRRNDQGLHHLDRVPAKVRAVAFGQPVLLSFRRGSTAESRPALYLSEARP